MFPAAACTGDVAWHSNQLGLGLTTVMPIDFSHYTIFVLAQLEPVDTMGPYVCLTTSVGNSYAAKDCL